jgi:hypothetical protein
MRPGNSLVLARLRWESRAVGLFCGKFEGCVRTIKQEML